MWRGNMKWPVFRSRDSSSRRSCLIFTCFVKS